VNVIQQKSAIDRNIQQILCQNHNELLLSNDWQCSRLQATKT